MGHVHRNAARVGWTIARRKLSRDTGMNSLFKREKNITVRGTTEAPITTMTKKGNITRDKSCNCIISHLSTSNSDGNKSESILVVSTIP